MTRSLTAHALTPGDAHDDALRRVKLALSEGVDEVAPDGSAHALVAAQMNTGSAALDQLRWASGRKHITAGMAALAPHKVLLRILRAMAFGRRIAVIELPETTPAAGLAQAARVQRETSEAVSTHLATLAKVSADGRTRLSRADATDLVRECDEAVVELLAVREVGVQALRDGTADVEPTNGGAR